MIVCSCNVISDRDIEAAIIEIMSAPEPPLPTPGVVWRHLSSRMRCCGCAPLAIETIYDKMEKLEAEGRICPAAGRNMRDELKRRALRNSRASRAGSASSEDDDGGPSYGRFLAAAE